MIVWISDNFLLLLLCAGISGGIGVYIANQKERNKLEGLLLGLFLGPIGWVIEGLLPDERWRSPDRKACTTALNLSGPSRRVRLYDRKSTLNLFPPVAYTVPTNKVRDVGDSRRGRSLATKSVEREWGIARFGRGNVLCKKITPDKVVLIESGGGWMYLDECTSVQWIPKPSDDEIASLVLGFPSSRLVEVQSFCSEPRTTNQIEENFTSLDIDVYHLRQLGVLREAGKIGRSRAYVWAGWSSEKLNRAIEIMASYATRSINNPA